jgi:hypothetical protein
MGTAYIKPLGRSLSTCCIRSITAKDSSLEISSVLVVPQTGQLFATTKVQLLSLTVAPEEFQTGQVAERTSGGQDGDVCGDC